uniref:FP protein C-terminal domain-containing protein n=1 Tax=Cacopsylla melanoneura TaxID=428564 RepID=A0A8D8UW28_9HEMI
MANPVFQLLLLGIVCSLNILNAEETTLSYNHTTETHQEQQENRESTSKKFYHNEWNRSEQRNKIRNLVLEGIPRTANEDVYQIVEDIGRQLGFENPLEEVERADRAHLAYLPHPECIIIRLVDLYAKDKWLHEYRQRKLYHAGWSLREHLTKASHELLNMTRMWARKNNYRYIWTKDCRILFRKNSQASAYHVNNVEHLKWITNVLENQTPRMRGDLRGPRVTIAPPSPAGPDSPPPFAPAPPNPNEHAPPPPHMPSSPPPEEASPPSHVPPSPPPHAPASPPPYVHPSFPPHAPVTSPPDMPPSPPPHMPPSPPHETPVSPPPHQPASPPPHFASPPPHMVPSPPFS